MQHAESVLLQAFPRCVAQRKRTRRSKPPTYRDKTTPTWLAPSVKWPGEHQPSRCNNAPPNAYIPSGGENRCSWFDYPYQNPSLVGRPAGCCRRCHPDAPWYCFMRIYNTTHGVGFLYPFEKPRVANKNTTSAIILSSDKEERAEE